MEIIFKASKVLSLFKSASESDKEAGLLEDDQEYKIVHAKGGKNVRYRLYQLIGPAGVRGCFIVPMFVRMDWVNGKKSWWPKILKYEAPIRVIDRFLQKSKLKYSLVTDYTCWTLKGCQAEIRKMTDCM